MTQDKDQERAVGQMQTNGSLVDGQGEDPRKREGHERQMQLSKSGWENTFENRMRVFKGMVMDWVNEKEVQKRRQTETG